MKKLMARLCKHTTLMDKIVESKRARTCRGCYRVWDKTVSATIGCIVFLVIMGTSICMVIQSTNNPAPESKFTFAKKNSKCTMTSDCAVLCENFDETFDLEQAINSISSACVSGIKLNLKSGVLTKNKIPTKWLEQLTIQVKMITLALKDITNIEDGAFSANSLKGISELRISQTNIKYFNRNIFKGIVSLDYFYLEFYEDKEVLIEYNFLENVSKLTRLQLTGCILTSESVVNITNSDVHLSELITLDIGYSKTKYLQANAFSRAANLRQLYIRGVGLEYLELDVFNNLSSLEQLHLEDNKLTSLEEGIFRQIKNNSHIQIHLHNNPWECNCSLEWLKDTYMNERHISKSTPLTCKNKDEKPFEEVDFCESGEVGENSSSEEDITSTTTNSEVTVSSSPEKDTTSTTVAVTVTEVTTSGNLGNTTRCKTTMANYEAECHENQSKVKYSSTKRRLLGNKMKINKTIFTFSIYETNYVPVEIKVEMNTEETLAEYLLWWSDNDGVSEGSCVTPLCKTLSIRGMEPNHTYTMCILLNNEEVVRPENCRGFKVLEEYSERPWIKNKTKNLVVVGSIIISIIILILAACITYWCVRCHPGLIKANERVIIIRRERQNTPSNMTSLEQSSYSTPSLSSTISSTNSSRCSSTTFSRTSSFNSDITYIRPRPILYNELIHRRRYSVRPPALAFTNIYENIPPMLPPRNS